MKKEQEFIFSDFIKLEKYNIYFLFHFLIRVNVTHWTFKKVSQMARINN